MDEKIKQRLQAVVDEKRYRHSLLAAEEAKNLAKHYGLDENEAYTAGLVHDIAKRFTPEENQKYIEKYHLSPELLEERAQNYVHSDVGAVVAKEWFGLSDEICDAVKYHTIPSKNMTAFAKIIFLADKLGRSELPEDLKDLKTLAYEDLDKAMLYFLTTQEKTLKERHLDQHPSTLEFIKSVVQ